MRWIFHLIALVIMNVFALLFAATYIPGFKIATDLQTLLKAAALLTALTIFVKPILKLLLGPVIVLTLGVGIILVNGAILIILDMLFKNLTIESVQAFILATLLIGLLNAVISARRIHT